MAENKIDALDELFEQMSFEAKILRKQNTVQTLRAEIDLCLKKASSLQKTADAASFCLEKDELLLEGNSSFQELNAHWRKQVSDYGCAKNELEQKQKALEDTLIILNKLLIENVKTNVITDSTVSKNGDLILTAKFDPKKLFFSPNQEYVEFITFHDFYVQKTSDVRNWFVVEKNDANSAILKKCMLIPSNILVHVLRTNEKIVRIDQRFVAKMQAKWKLVQNKFMAIKDYEIQFYKEIAI